MVKNVDSLETIWVQRTTAFKKNYSISHTDNLFWKETTSFHANLLGEPFVQLLAAV